MNFPLDPGSGSLISVGEFLVGVAVIKVLIEKSFLEPGRTTSGGETTTTIEASILLNSPMMAILFCVSGATFRALFYNPSVKKSFLPTILPCFSKVFSMPFPYFNPKFALVSTSSASIIGGMGDRSECSTHLTGAPALLSNTPTTEHRRI